MRRSIRTIFTMPLLVAVACSAGLVAGLLGDGWWDAASWVGLGVPVVLAVRYGRGSPAKAGAREPRAARP